jgi:GntR family transcriptional repressor for pyruvate dehydrogenase complex
MVRPPGSDRASTVFLAVKPVRPAFEQVAEQLQTLIARGALPAGTRLPTEAVLAQNFGVSRATVREALRMLSARGLIHTTKGPNGGSYIKVPSVDLISESLRTNIDLLTATHDLSLAEFLEARWHLEVPAARLAATRREQGQLDEILASVPEPDTTPTVEQHFDHNRNFHRTVLAACGNRLLSIAAQPIFLILQTHLARSNLARGFHDDVTADHRRIVTAIEAGDAESAGVEMERHLERLRPTYERVWRRAQTEITRAS